VAKELTTGDNGCVKVLWSLLNKCFLFKINSSVSLSENCLVWESLFALVSLEPMFVELLNLLPLNLLYVLLQDDNNESTLNEILCFRNTGVEIVLLFVQDSAIVPAEGEDVDGAQFLVHIA
jgi:hypothetical protein